METTTHADEVHAGERFTFGDNWRSFLDVLDEGRMAGAEQSLKLFLEVDTLAGRTFLDVGSGSGLFSLAARRLGARVTSFDYDPSSVGCTQELKRRYFPDDPDWTVGSGSALDGKFLAGLGQFDVVYSWGVLHHTGAMWEAIGNVLPLVRPGGTLFISIYNTQVYWTRFYTTVKRTYNRVPSPAQKLIAGTFITFKAAKGALKDALFLRDPRERYRERARTRGMSVVHDWIDWIGGYPFETAAPEAVFDFVTAAGFVLEKLKTCGGGPGCNEFRFRRNAP
jgi:2-polyprenyl-3-methyl-5-hydroxy-6-metoxy-1,4-benzoquinol methylase